MINFMVSLILAYLIGSIPTSFIFGKFFKNIDIRKHGSGNVGATNVFRVVGKTPAIAVLLIDILKGVISVTVIPDIFFNNVIGVTLGLEFYKILLGAAAILGHVFSVFLRFKGGKGVATSMGVLLILSPKALLACVALWIIVFAIFKIVSVASIAASVFLPIISIIFQSPIYFILFSVLLCVGSVYKHKSNIGRLLRGEEKRLI